ncbi:MAG: DUF1475 family protein [Opitutaceae bacterium]|nr:DUF1475 family protein [Opitutaceae bacterium]MBP9912454.1 DUF1475 family protein [Opitutaceae bacterium]
MIWFLRGFFIIVLASMLAVTSWASLQVPLFETPRAVVTHPWFIATLFDTYWAFLTFFLWVAYKEPSWPARGLWLLAILLLGNIAMAGYALIQLFRVSAETKLATLLHRTQPVPVWVPAILVALIVAVGLIA